MFTSRPISNAVYPIHSLLINAFQYIHIIKLPPFFQDNYQRNQYIHYFLCGWKKEVLKLTVLFFIIIIFIITIDRYIKKNTNRSTVPLLIVIQINIYKPLGTYKIHKFLDGK